MENTTINNKKIEYLLNKYSNTVFCNNQLRQIKVDVITRDLYKVYTIPF